MKFVEPKVFMLGYTTVNHDTIAGYLEHIGCPNWETDAPADSAEELIEIAGRTCYRSFEPGMNKNVTKVREGNREYLGNILKQKHGSVFEHASVTFAFCDVSRVFTHEMVRHRLCAFSQESLRYVRLDDLKAYFPRAFADNDQDSGDTQLYDLFGETFEKAEDVQKQLATLLGLDNMKDFESKKKLTSAMRRLAPDGLATTIIVTTNHRNWRHILDLRTSGGAEEEMRLVMRDVAAQLKHTFPNIYQDMEMFEDGHVEFDNGRI